MYHTGKRPLSYPAGFLVRAKEWLPKCKDLHDLIAQNSPDVGSWLSDNRLRGFTPEGILYCLDAKNLEELYVYVQRLVYINKLFEEWTRIFKQWCDSTI